MDSMLRIGICDDETAARDQLRFGLEKILHEDREKIVYEFSSGRSAASWLKNHPGEIDLLFLDVEMQPPNGMETARQIRSFDREILIVFVTGYKDYVFEGYEVGALDYVIKPPEPEKLRQILERAGETIGKKTDKMFLCKNTEGTYRMPLAQISCFYSDRRKVVLVYGDREYAFYGKLDDIQEQAGSRFVRIHQRYLVNADRVEHIGKDSVLADGRAYPVSRSMKNEAMAAFARAMLEEKNR